MDTILLNRLKRMEDSIREAMTSPTIPKYNTGDFHTDLVPAQIVVDWDDRLSWYDGTMWNYYASGAVVTSNVPEDVIEGQIAIGSDCSLCWYSNGQWRTVVGNRITGNTPQDPIEGQIVMGNNTLAWFCSGSWWGLAP